VELALAAIDFQLGFEFNALPGRMENMRATRQLLGAALILATTVAGCHEMPPEAPPRVADPASRRTTRSGEVLGFEADYGSQAWLGIRFAAPPVDKLRWRAPLPPAAWSGTLEALSFGSPCVQYASLMGGVKDAKPGTPVGNEDCLFLNIWAPRLTPDAVPKSTARLPVMFWIHGGGNTIGEAGFYNGGNLAGSQKMIVVTTNYRLGPFGWFRHPALNNKTTTDLDRSGNFGTLDLIRSLEWVRDNIASFGGDPGNVTIFGESAGGTNVFSLLLSARAHGLFQRAIAESGGLFFSNPLQAENATDATPPGDLNSSSELVLRLIERDRIAKDRDGAQVHLSYVTAENVARYLRNKTAYEILNAYQPLPGVGMIRMPTVFNDGLVLPKEEPLALLQSSGGFSQVPVILGTNRDENKLFMFGDPDKVRKLFWMFPRLRDEKQYKLTAEYMAKNWKAYGVDEPAARMRQVGPSVFAYRFDWDEEPTIMGADLAVMLGAAHGFEIPFVFGHFDLGKAGNMMFTTSNEPGRLALSSAMMSYWSEFAYHGAPGHGRDGKLPEWSAWDSSRPEAPKYMVLDTDDGGGLRMSAETVTQASVLAAIEADPRLATRKEKCRIYHDIAAWSRGFTEAEYAKACADLPFDGYPWG
jgi:para-nitrobenzyl esterase